MAQISATTLFNVGDKVWFKPSLDFITALEPLSLNQYWIKIYVPFYLFKVTQINIKQNDNSNYSVLYTISLFMPQAQTQEVLKDSTGVVLQTVYEDIEEENLYSFEEGLNKIFAKIQNFQEFLNSLSNL